MLASKEYCTNDNLKLLVQEVELFSCPLFDLFKRQLDSVLTDFRSHSTYYQITQCSMAIAEKVLRERIVGEEAFSNQ